MGDALPERQSLGDACQRFLRISKRPFGHRARVSRTYPGIVPTIHEPMGLMSFQIIKSAPGVSVVPRLGRLTSKKRR